MAPRLKGRAARAGGQAARYEARHAARSTRRYAPCWTDAAACAVFQELHTVCHARHMKRDTLELLRNRLRARTVVARASRGCSMSALDSRLAYAQLEVYMARVRDADKNSDNAAAMRTVHTFLKTLRERWRL
jgi:hypothetical protein